MELNVYRLAGGGRRAAALAVVLVGLSYSLAADAQTNEEINAGLQFSFVPPGARSLAMGGAFTGLADDATAAFANPAGLIWLTRNEVSVEGRQRNYTTQYPYTGSGNFSPTGNGIDTSSTLDLREFESDVSGASFVSYAHVPSKRWRVAFYRHELAAYEAELRSEGPFIRNGGTGPPFQQSLLRSRLAAIDGRLDLDIVNYGVAAAWSATDQLWLGLGLSYSTFDYSAETRRYVTSAPTRSDGLSEVSFEPADFSDANETERSIQDGDDEDMTATLGLLWKSSNGKHGLGLVYRQAPSYDLDYSFQWQAQRIRLRDETGNENFVDPGVAAALSGTTSFDVPDVLSLGWHYRPRQNLTVSVQVDQVKYSSLEPEANVISVALRGSFNGRDLSIDSCGDYNQAGERFPTGEVTATSVPCNSPFLENFEIDDAVEVHVGVEYVLARQRPIALRLGAWYDPDHQLRYDFGDTPPNEVAFPQDRFGFRFPEGDDEVHLAGGVGWVAGSIQVDFAFDFSDRADFYSLSSVFRF